MMDVTLSSACGAELESPARAVDTVDRPAVNGTDLKNDERAGSWVPEAIVGAPPRFRVETGP